MTRAQWNAWVRWLARPKDEERDEPVPPTPLKVLTYIEGCGDDRLSTPYW